MSVYDKEETQRRLGSRHAPRPGEVYRHYKGGYYSIIATSVMEETGEHLVTYHSSSKATNWTRTLDNFLEAVEVDGAKVGRFTWIQE